MGAPAKLALEKGKPVARRGRKAMGLGSVNSTALDRQAAGRSVAPRFPVLLISSGCVQCPALPF